MPNDDDTPRPSARRPLRDDEYADDFDDRPRRRRRSEDEGDETGGIIPYKNPKALAAYYCGVFGLISCVLFLGIFGILPIIFGIQGLKHAKKHPQTRGQAHAIVGIVLGSFEILTFLAQVAYIVYGLNQK